MSTLWKSALLAGAAWFVVADVAAAQTAASAGDDTQIEEVLVTARRREETLKDTPVAVTAFSADKLDKTGAADITDLQRSTPNMTLQVARGSNSTLIAFIRGVGQQDPLWGFEPGVGLYIDDVYVARPQGAVLDIFDVNRIEVLRGPQGTLYGRNTIGGAIKYVTAKIGPERQFAVKTNLGSYNQADFIGSAKTPLGDKAGASVSIARYAHDGYGQNVFTGAQQYNKDVWAGRTTFEFTPTDSLFFRLSGDYTRDDSNPRHGHREVPGLDILGRPIPGGGVLSGVYDTAAGSGDKNYVRASGLSFLGEWTVNDQIKLKSVTAYRAGTTNGTIDFDELPFPYLDVPARYNDHAFTQELQLLYSGQRLQGVAGVFYLNGTSAGAFDTVVGQINTTIATAGHVDTESWAAYADFSYSLTDQLSVSVGGRYTRDAKEGEVYRQNFTGIRSPLFGNGAAIPGLVRSNFTNSKDFEKFTPRISVSYKITPDMTGYASYSQGFKSGGFDMRADVVLTPNAVNGYQPEIVDAYELGLKGAYFDRRLTLNTAAFYSKYHDQQVTLQTPVGASIASQVENVGESHMYGFEAEGVAAFTRAFSANFSLGYIKAEFDKYLALDLTSTPPVVRDFSNSRDFQNTPEWTANIGFNYTIDLGDRGSVAILPSASYRSAMHMFEVPSILDQGAYWLYDASVVWTSPTGHYRAGLHGKNLGDERYRVGGYNFPQSAAAFYGNSVSAFYGPPRTVTLSLEAKF